MLEAELFRPDGDGPHPAVLLMHGCGGLSAAARTALHGHAQFLVKHAGKRFLPSAEVLWKFIARNGRSYVNQL